MSAPAVEAAGLAQVSGSRGTKSSSGSSKMVPKRFPSSALVFIWAVQLARGDGPAVTSTSSGPISSTSSTTPVCNPFRGVRYLMLGNGGAIRSGVCEASWDLHEVEVFDTNGVKISAVASSPTGSLSSYPASNAVDGDTESFWAGDFDVGLSCSCWNSAKLDGQQLLLDLQSEVRVGEIRLHQGDNTWSLTDIRIHCGDGAGDFSDPPMELGISMALTQISCASSGCEVTYQSISPYWSCRAVSWSHTRNACWCLLAAFCVLFLD